MKTEFERRVKIKMKRLQRKKSFFEQTSREQAEIIKKLSASTFQEVKEAMQTYISNAGFISNNEVR